MTDLTYLKNGLFTTFFSESKQGKEVLNDMIKQNDGSNKIFTMHADKVIKQLRAAGYSVSKAPKISKQDMQKIFAELDLLLTTNSN